MAQADGRIQELMSEPMSEAGTPWWQTAVIYQVYPRSFQDSNGDGTGDLQGIERRLDYLVELGITAVWISPIYPSPMADFGYDVADYTGIDPLFGTMTDFDTLLAAVHERGLKLILDFVPNHTSEEHAWFAASRSSRTDPKRDWYLWRDPGPEGGVPNNWQSNFGGPAWTLDKGTGQYYCHSFLPQQPDLNWRNPEVRRAMYAAMTFWLDKGIDGFRMDVLWLLIKDDQFRDNPVNPDYTGGNTLGSVLPQYTANQPETLEIVREMRTLLDRYAGDRLLIGEIYLPVAELVAYYGAAPDSVAAKPDLRGAQLPFNFHLILASWNASSIAQLIHEYEAALPAGAWPNWVLGNHDQHRLATRVGAGQARTAAVLLLTLRGTPTMYNGDELGLPDAYVAPAEIRDPAELRQPGLGLGRDPERSPMVWDWSENAGFTAPGVRTWLPLVENWPAYAVEGEARDGRSMLALYRALLRLRGSSEALTLGSVAEVSASGAVLSYTRRAGAKAFRMYLNMSEASQSTAVQASTLRLTSMLDQEDVGLDREYTLRPGEAIVTELA